MTVFSIVDESGNEVFNICAENTKLAFYATKEYYSFSPADGNIINVGECKALYKFGAYRRN